MIYPYERKETLLEAENVSLCLDGQVILRDINVTIQNIVRPGVEQGQVIGFLGPSGIGKTQFFRILAGLQRPTEGHVYVSAQRVPVACGMVGMVPQNYLLFEHYTVLKNLTAAARQAGLSPAEARGRALAMLERFKLTAQMHAFPAQLSGGQRQRVAIAQQLLCSSHFLLLDEPFSGLDPLMVEKVCELINELATSDELNTVIIVTHDIGVAVSVCDTLWLMGRARDEEGDLIPGATILKTYDLIDRELAWHRDISCTPRFAECVAELRNEFRGL